MKVKTTVVKIRTVIRPKDENARVMALVTKVMGDNHSRDEALEAATTLTAEEMRRFVALLAGDRQAEIPGDDSDLAAS